VSLSTLHMAHEKSPLASKKFVAYLIAEMTWKLLLIIGLVGVIHIETNADPSGEGVSIWFYWVLLSCVVVAGFVEAGFIGGQAWLDKYVRIAQIAATRDASATPSSSFSTNPPTTKDTP